ncbi:MAG TPA: hypothetical protein VGM75_20760 [Pseudonocardiaceae bacterium]
MRAVVLDVRGEHVALPRFEAARFNVVAQGESEQGRPPVYVGGS